MIDVEQLRDKDPLEFHVRLTEENGETRHRVTMSRSTYERLTAGQVTPVRCIQAAFEYLLEREPKEAILRSFDITVISRYFPDFETAIGKYLITGS